MNNGVSLWWPNQKIKPKKFILCRLKALVQLKMKQLILLPNLFSTFERNAHKIKTLTI